MKGIQQALAIFRKAFFVVLQIFNLIQEGFEMSSALMCAHCYRDHNQTMVVHSKQPGFSPAIRDIVHRCALKLQVEAAAGLNSGLSCSSCVESHSAYDSVHTIFL